jgi:hypothetical protein
VKTSGNDGLRIISLLARLANLIPKQDHAQVSVTKKDILSCRSAVAAKVSLGGESTDPDD